MIEALLGSAGGNIISSLIGASATKRAAKTQARAQQAALNLQERMFNQQREDFAPWRDAGGNALGQIQALLANPSSVTSLPGYDFRLGEGVKALERSAAAPGGAGLYGGSTLKALTRYGQDFGTSEMNNQFNRLASLAGLGQVGATGSAAAAGNFGAMGGNSLSAMGDARAAGTIGSANAWSNALGNIANNWQEQQMLRQYFPGGYPMTPQAPSMGADWPLMPTDWGLWGGTP